MDEARLAQALAEYEELGFARLGQVVDEDACRRMRERAEEIMLGRVVVPGLFFQRDTETGNYGDLEYGKGWQGPTLNYRKLEKLERDEVFRRHIELPLFGRVAARLLGERVAIYRATLFNKAQTGGTTLPWHQDGGQFWGLDRDPRLQIWTAIDDAPEDAGCLEIIPRTHRGGLATPLGGMIPAEMVRARLETEAPVRLPARAGEAILVHNYVWHGSAVNRSGKARRGLSVCYMDASTRCLRTKRAPRVFVRVFEGR